MIAVGYGVTAPGRADPSVALQKVELDVLQADVCIAQYGAAYVFPSTLCAGRVGGGVCAV